MALPIKLALITSAGLLLAACSLGNSTTNSHTPQSDSSETTRQEQVESGQLPPTNPTQLMDNETASSSSTTKTYTLSDVAAHSAPNDCWLAIHGKVYDVSGFGDTGHPGGPAIYQSCGKDATQLFETRPMGSGTPHDQRARDLMARFYMGDLSQ